VDSGRSCVELVLVIYSEDCQLYGVVVMGSRRMILVYSTIVKIAGYTEFGASSSIVKNAS
jgi:hypothetical protein